MTPQQKFTTTLAALGVAVVSTLMIARHANDTRQTQKVKADMVSDETIVKALHDANVPVNGLMVRSVSGVVVVRGSGDKKAVEAVLKQLNVQRVANLVVPSFDGDDDAIRRDAERQLAQLRSLDGCTLRVSCQKGVLRVSGTVQSDLQVDAARQVLRKVTGVQEVKMELAQAATPKS
jgi:osmotically-inducible protein OsmY